MENLVKHYGDFTLSELSKYTPDQLIKIILDRQMEDNICIMTDSYKMTHWALLPPGIKEMYSYLESRGGEMKHCVFFGLQYYVKKYLAGVRVSEEKMKEAREMNIAHFGFDCFDDTLWRNILTRHGGMLPIEIKAVPEGTVVDIKHIMMSIRNTDHDHCAQLGGILETLLMKIWATCTVASYALCIMEDIRKGHRKSSDMPIELLNFLHHDFGYRGCSSEESSRLLGAAALTVFYGTDTLGALKLIKDYYDVPCAGYSVIASEHSVVCSFGALDDDEIKHFEHVLNTIFDRYPGLKILSLVSDTNNIWRVARKIGPALKSKFIGRKNKMGELVKIVFRPDSGDAMDVLFGFTDNTKLQKQLEIIEARGHDITIYDLRIGLFGILLEEYGASINSKGYKVLHPQIGVLQGDGISRKTINEIYERMEIEKIDYTMLVFGSGGKYLQAHERDEMKFAIKATNIINAQNESLAIRKNPVTDVGKASKSGYLKLTFDGTVYHTVSSLDEGYEEAEDLLETVLLNGVLHRDEDFNIVRSRIVAYLERTEKQEQLQIA